VKTFAKIILSKLSSSHNFYDILEKLYIYATFRRFQYISRTKLVSLHNLVKTNFSSETLNLTRIGSVNDGGYVMQIPCANGTKVISLGIADNMDFELELIDSGHAQEVYCFDGSIQNLPELRENVHFESKFVKTSSGQDAVTLNEILGRIQADEVILKIDIEGDEWSVLGDLEEDKLSNFSQIIGEFHGLASSIDEEDITHKINLLGKLHRHFYLVNTHPNNWSRFRIVQGVPLFDVAELSFMNKKLVSIEELGVGGSELEKIIDSLNSPCNPENYEYLG
jgi:hypothetical protein